MDSVLRTVNDIADGNEFTIPLNDWSYLLGVTPTEAFALLGGVIAEWICLERQYVCDAYAKIMTDLANDVPVTVHMVRAPGVSKFISIP